MRQPDASGAVQFSAETKVQAHEVEAQRPHAQRLVVPGQHRAGQVIETRPLLQSAHQASV